MSFNQALFGDRYRKATWICFVLTFFHQNTGLNAINMYSNTMIQKINDENPGSFPLSATQATYFVGVFGFIGALLGPLVINSLKRKNNFLYGHATMGISMVLMAFF